MEVYTTEQEQIAQLKKWLKSYGPPVIIGVLIALAIGFGWRYWQARKIKMGETASIAYVNMIGASMNGDNAEAKFVADNLVKEYPNTPYAQFAALLLAKMAVNKNNFNAAAKRLEWVIEKADFDAIKQTARIRLAEVYIAQKQPQKALSTLSTVNDQAYIGMINNIKGDAYAALHKTTLAKQAYETALKQLPTNSNPFITTKIANLP